MQILSFQENAVLYPELTTGQSSPFNLLLTHYLIPHKSFQAVTNTHNTNQETFL